MSFQFPDTAKYKAWTKELNSLRSRKKRILELNKEQSKLYVRILRDLYIYHLIHEKPYPATTIRIQKLMIGLPIYTPPE